MTKKQRVPKAQVERILEMSGELRNFAVRSRWPTDEFFAACLLTSAAMVKRGKEGQVVRAFRELIRDARKGRLFIALSGEGADELAFEKMYG